MRAASGNGSRRSIPSIKIAAPSPERQYRVVHLLQLEQMPAQRCEALLGDIVLDLAGVFLGGILVHAQQLPDSGFDFRPANGWPPTA